MRSKLSFVLVAMTVGALAARADDEKKDSGKALGSLVKEMRQASDDDRKKTAEGLLLSKPGDWFEKNFGKEKGAALKAAYETETRTLEKRFHLLFKGLGHAVKVIEGVKIEKDGKDANGPQKAAFDAMKDQFALYTVHFKEDADAKPIASVWSFAFVDGAWKFVGSLRALVKEAPDSKDDDDPLAAVIDCRVAQVGEGKTLLSVGTDDDVDKGTEFWVYRGTDYVGKVVVTSVKKDCCEARVLRTKKGEKVQAGDACTTRFPF